MRIQDVLFENIGRTLYHGTLRKFLPSILEVGLWPSLGEFTRTAYSDYEEAGIELEELVFAADKDGLSSCVSAILGAMTQEGIDDTVDNFFRYGAIVVIREGGDQMQHREDDSDEDHPQTVEPGDYYSRYRVRVDYALTGWRLRSFLRRHDIVIDRFSQIDRAAATALLVRYAAGQHPDRSHAEIVQRVRSLTNKQMLDRLHRYRMHQLSTAG